MLPVVKFGTEAQVLDLAINRSDLWGFFEIIKLTENMRAKDDPDFAEDLLRIGSGEANETIEIDGKKTEVVQVLIL